LVAALGPIVGLDAAVGDSLNARVPPLEEVVLPRWSTPAPRAANRWSWCWMTCTW